MVITGANTGIGRVTAQELAARGARLILACRSEKKTLPVIAAIKEATGNSQVEFVPLDLASLDSVRRCAEEILSRTPQIQVLINNAGLGGVKGSTEEGFELTFGVNHLGHFLLTQLLLPRLKESAPSRIVNVASKAHCKAKKLDLDALKRPSKGSTLSAYCVSKLCNVLFNAELAKRLEGSGVTTYALHPGVVASDIWRKIPWPIRPLIKLFMISNEEGAKTSVHCATSPDLAEQSGLYYDRCAPTRPSRLARDPVLAAELWRCSEVWVGLGAEAGSLE